MATREHILDRPVLTAAVFGAVAGLMLLELGAGEVSGYPSTALALSIGLGVGAVFGYFKRARLVLVFDLVVLACYYVIAATPMMDVLDPRWIRNDSLPARPADALIVLSAGVVPPGLLDGTATARLLTGLELMRGGAAARLITTRVAIHSGGGIVRADDDQRRLVQLAGLDSVWSAVDSVESTRNEAEHTATLLPPPGRTIVVVTSPMHTRRACATFEGVGFRVVCVAAADREFDTTHPRFPRSRIPAFRFYIYERIGMWKYKHEGWVK